MGRGIKPPPEGARAHCVNCSRWNSCYAASPITTPLPVRYALAEKQPVETDVVFFHGSHQGGVKVSGLPDAIQPSEGGRVGG